MGKILVEYGTPGQRGVTTLLGIGADELDAHADKTDKALSTASKVSLGVLVYGLVTGNKLATGAGIGSGLVSWFVSRASK